MRGNEVKLWAGLGGFPNKILPGGYVMETTAARAGKNAYQDQVDLVQVDWDGHIVWKFDKTELIADDPENPVYMARHHHDFQREGSTVGYYYPNGEPKTTSGNTLILTHENLYNHNISDKRLIDDKIIEVDGVDPNARQITGMAKEKSDETERLDFCVASINKKDVK